jgi:transcriptional regulator with XRE-family HTH domain
MPHILPDVLKRLRKAKGWSLDQLAENAKINKQTLHRLEKGKHGSSREDNPFALFLDNLTEDMNEGDTFEGYAAFDYPNYRICADIAAQFTDGDIDLADHILRGHIELNQMPKEIREPVNFKRRAEWVREKVQEFRDEMAMRFEHPAREETSP